MTRQLRKGLGLLTPFQTKKDFDQLPEGVPTDVTEFLRTQIRYAPRKAEAQIISRIEAAADEFIAARFSPGERALERLYLAVRIPEFNVHGVVKTTADGEIVWELDEEGNPKEDWARLDGMEVERAVMDLQRVILDAADEVAKLEGRVTFAYYVKEDEYWDAYKASMRDGTINDRTSAAHRASRDSRYYFLYLYWIWKRASVRMRLLEQTKKDLEFMRSRFLKDPEIARNAEGAAISGRRIGQPAHAP